MISKLNKKISYEPTNVVPYSVTFNAPFNFDTTKAFGKSDVYIKGKGQYGQYIPGNAYSTYVPGNYVAFYNAAVNIPAYSYNVPVPATYNAEYSYRVYVPDTYNAPYSNSSFIPASYNAAGNIQYPSYWVVFPQSGNMSVQGFPYYVYVPATVKDPAYSYNVPVPAVNTPSNLILDYNNSYTAYGSNPNITNTGLSSNFGSLKTFPGGYGGIASESALVKLDGVYTSTSQTISGTVPLGAYVTITVKFKGS